MKKSQLRHIIRESIKQLLTEQSQWTHYHIYEGCQGTIAHGVGSTVVPSIVTCLSPGNCGLQGYIANDTLHNNNLLHQAWGSPQIGQIVKFYTCNPNEPSCPPTCMKYIDTCEFGSGLCGQYPTFGFGMNSNPGQTVGFFGDCVTCDSDETDYLSGCIDPEACNYNPSATNLSNSAPYVNCFYAVDECETCVPNALALSDSSLPTYNAYSQWQASVTVQSNGCGCTDANALNYSSLATIDDGSCNYGYKCESVWFIQTGRRDKNIGNQCIPGTSQNPGNFSSMQLCQNHCKETLLPTLTKKDITPFTTDPQSKKVEPGDEEMQDRERMQKLANIK